MTMTITAPQIRAIHALKKSAGLTDDDYRGLLKDRYRVASSKDLSESAAGGLIEQLKELGGQAGSRRPKDTASGKYASVLRALWLSAYNLAIVRDHDDRALIAFVQRQTGVSHTRFLTEEAEGAKAIEALKSWIARETGITWPTMATARQMGVTISTARKRRTVQAIADRLIAAGQREFVLDRYITLSGLPPLVRMSDAQIDRLSSSLGAMLRARMAATERSA